MEKKIKTLQWNIGGGKVRLKDADSRSSGSYNLDGFKDILAVVRAEKPDVITLQEVHSDDRENQVQIIAKTLGYPYSVSDFYSDSHIEQGQRLGQGIISRFPISDHAFQLFNNPEFKIVWKDGSTVTSHDKGLTSCRIIVDHTLITVQTLHLLPFDPFKIDPLSEAAALVFSDVQEKIRNSDQYLLIQGDFNLGSRNPDLKTLMPDIIDAATNEVPLAFPTIPNGEKPDRIAYRGLHLVNYKVIDTVLTDHYPIVVTFEL